MADRLGVGIIGLGWVSDQYIRSFAANRNCEITALCHPNLARAQQVKERFGLHSSLHSSLDSMLEHKHLDIVCILTPNYLHLPHALLSARAGKHILLEKPISLNWAQALEIDAAVRQSGVKSSVGFVLRWNSLFQNIQSVIRRGLLGRIFHIEVDYLFHLDDRLRCFEWCSHKETGGSVLQQSGCHAVDGMFYFMNDRVTEVTATSARNRQDFDHDTSFSVFVKFAGGATGKIYCSYDTCNPYVYNINIYGTEGSIRNDQLYAQGIFPGQTAWLTMPSIMPNTENVEHHPFPQLVNHFVDCIREDNVPMTAVANVLHVSEIIEAAEISASQEGQRITLPL
ncbi:MAG: Gfo/Idh/MocA family oxidoreductase [Caldilineaceae bacterium]|nr:Gfo/Idh/MocA family oxidoreductase [Caldilineaceae bacterium]